MYLKEFIFSYSGCETTVFLKGIFSLLTTVVLRLYDVVEQRVDVTWYPSSYGHLISNLKS